MADDSKTEAKPPENTEATETEEQTPLGAADTAEDPGSAPEEPHTSEEEGEPSGPQIGRFAKARVTELGDEFVTVDLGDGATGRFDSHEARSPTGDWLLSINEEVEVLIDELEEEIWLVSMEKAEKVRVFQRLVQLAKKKAPVRGVITRVVRGGFSVDIGVRAFLPGRESGIRSNRAMEVVGRSVTCMIQRFDEDKGEVVLTRKKFAQQEAKKRREALYDRLVEGDVVQGVVSSLTRFGAFVDLGGADGLLHVTEMGWNRIKRPEDVVAVGDKLEVKVVEIDRNRDRIGLSLKALQTNPWSDLAERCPPGTRVTGEVVSLVDFGAFVRIEEGIEGLIHISELSWDRNIRNAAQLLEVGQEIEVEVVKLDIDAQRLGLSLKRLQDNPWEKALEDKPVGTRVTGKVTSVVEFGVFVEIAPGVEGLLHVSDMSWTARISNPADLRDFTVGEEIEVMVLDIDWERQRISLGLKQLEKDPWADNAELLVEGKVIEVTISRLAPFGAFATIASGIEGLIHISELAEESVRDVSDAVTTGQTVKVRVINVDEKARKVGLSIKSFLVDGEEGTMKSFSDDDTATTSLGDLLKEKGIVDADDDDASVADEQATTSDEDSQAEPPEGDASKAESSKAEQAADPKAASAAGDSEAEESAEDETAADQAAGDTETEVSATDEAQAEETPANEGAVDETADEKSAEDETEASESADDETGVDKSEAGPTKSDKTEAVEAEDGEAEDAGDGEAEGEDAGDGEAEGEETDDKES